MYSYPHKTAYYSVSGQTVARAVRETREAGLYFHIPFCRAKCGYCNLFSVANGEQTVPEKYTDAMLDHTRAYLSHGVNITSYTFGGGTPSLLPIADFERILTLVQKYSRAGLSTLSSAIEVSPDCPIEKLRYLKDRFSRVSIGIQSFDDAVLRALKRNYDAAACRAAIIRIKDAGIAYFNADLIYGVPRQSRASFLSSVETLIGFGTPEIFLYPLYIRPQTGLSGSPATDRAMLSFYRAARDRLCGCGYRQLSMRRFSKVPRAADDTGCGFENVLSVGVGGRSYAGSLHFCAPFETDGQKRAAAIRLYTESAGYYDGLYGYELDADELKRRYIIKNLFVTDGLNLADYAARFNKSDARRDFSAVGGFLADGYAYQKDGRIFLTSEGLARSDMLAPQVISETVKQAMTARGYYEAD